MQRQFALFWIITLGLLYSISAQSTPLKQDAHWVHGQLDNGMKYHFYRTTKQPKVSLRLLMHVGARNETVAQWGTAHFIEHMSFNGSKHFSPNEIYQFISNIGGQFGNDLNAYTNYDRTVYQLDLPNKKSLQQALYWMRDIGDGLTLNQTEINKEKGVILGERRTQEANSTIINHWYHTLATNERDTHPILGYNANISSMNHQRLSAFYSTWYQPQKAELIVVGDITPKDLAQRVQSTFSSWQSHPTPNIPPTPQLTLNDAILQSQREDDEGLYLQYSYLDKGITSVEIRNEYFMQMLLNNLISDRFDTLAGQSEELNRKLSQDTVSFMTRTIKLLEINTDSSERGIQLRTDFLQNIASLRDKGVTQVELADELAFWQKDIENYKSEKKKDTNVDIAENAVDTLMYADTFTDPDQFLTLKKQFISQLTLAKVNQALYQRLAITPQILDLVAPTVDLKTEQTRLINYHQILNQHGTESHFSQQKFMPKTPETAGQIVESHTINADSSLPIQHWILSNGLNVYYYQSHNPDDQSIHLKLIGLGGNASLTSEQKKYAPTYPAIFANAHPKGASRKAFYDYLDKNDVTFSFHVLETSQSLNITATRKHLRPSFVALREMMSNLQFSSAEIQAQMDSMLIWQRSFLQNPGIQLIVNSRKLITDSTKSFLIFPMQENVAPNKNLVKTVFNQLYGTNKANNLVIVANQPSASLKPLLEKYLANIPLNHSPQGDYKMHIKPNAPHINIWHIAHQKSTQSLHVNIAPQLSWTIKDQIIDSMLHDIIVDRMNNHIREELGLDYSPYLDEAHYPGAPYLVSMYSATIEAENTQAIKTAMQDVIVSLNNITDEELETARAQTRNESIIKKNDENSVYCGYIADTLVNRQSIERLKDINSIIDSISKDDLIQLASLRYKKQSNQYQFYSSH
ncbi:M16 family metallopeptidase [Vibrio nitrifigilis]|uniref:Insulinase family protein n=1 Tax=Vibrio nitrifigilis TaxID=2789781 RepID=A0ABS0GCC8_9VIBR|nr:M16 family metallopeptidase [Vibrio nitrifigilis]MBF9000058.1 insulinase family protein [Vibrio nitrifigilis]